MAVETGANPYKAVKDYVENGGPKDWKHQQRVADLYSMANVMRMYFFSPKEPGQCLMPEPLVGVELLRVETLACYYLVENPLGLKYQISMNSLYLDRPIWEQYESLAHELVHLYQENHPDLPKCKRGYHNEAFVSIAEDIGLHPRLGLGCHVAPADGQFARLMERYEVKKPEYVKTIPPLPPSGKKNWWDDDRGSRKGASTLLKWVCACQPPKNSVRTGRKDLMALCLSCGKVFSPELESNPK